MNLLIPKGQLAVECAYKLTGHFSTKDQKEGKKINEVFNLSLPKSSFQSYQIFVGKKKTNWKK